MSFLDDIHDPDDPLAPPREFLQPVKVPSLSDAKTETKVEPSKPQHRRKEGPSKGDSVLLSYMEPNRPDLAKQGGDTVLRVSMSPTDTSGRRNRSTRSSTSPSHRSSRRSVDDDPDEIAYLKIKAEKERREAQTEADRCSQKALFGCAPTTAQSNTPTPPSSEKDLDKEMALTDCTPQVPRGPRPSPIVPTRHTETIPHGPISATLMLPPIPREGLPRRKFSEPQNIGASRQMAPLEELRSTAKQSRFQDVVTVPGDRLPPVQTTPPAEVSAASSPVATSPRNLQQIPGIGSILKDIPLEVGSRPRQSSISAPGPSPILPISLGGNAASPSSTVFTSPTFLSGAPSPATAASPSTYTSGSITTSPHFPGHTFDAQTRRPFNNHVYSHGAVGPPSYATSPSAFSPDTGTNITTPSERGAVREDVVKLHTLDTVNTPARLEPNGHIAPSPTSHQLGQVGGLPPHAAFQSPREAASQYLSATLASRENNEGQQHPDHVERPGIYYRCKHQGCTAPPFNTQYLLK